MGARRSGRQLQAMGRFVGDRGVRCRAACRLSLLAICAGQVNWSAEATAAKGRRSAGGDIERGAEINRPESASARSGSAVEVIHSRRAESLEPVCAPRWSLSAGLAVIPWSLCAHTNNLESNTY
jgi:hypothetical protein